MPWLTKSMFLYGFPITLDVDISSSSSLLNHKIRRHREKIGESQRPFTNIKFDETNISC